MLSNFDPDKIVETIESAEEKLDTFIDKSTGVVDKAEHVTGVLDKQVNASSAPSSSPASDDVQNDD